MYASSPDRRSTSLCETRCKVVCLCVRSSSTVARIIQRRINITSATHLGGKDGHDFGYVAVENELIIFLMCITGYLALFQSKSVLLGLFLIAPSQ